MDLALALGSRLPALPLRMFRKPPGCCELLPFAAESFTTPQWEFTRNQQGAADDWAAFRNDVGAQVEDSYSKFTNGFGSKAIIVSPPPFQFELDFELMTQRNVESGTVHRIRRTLVPAAQLREG